MDASDFQTSLNTSLTPSATKPKLLDQVRHAIRLRHYSIRTQEAYVNWARRFILFHNKRHPNEMGQVEVGAFLTHLAVDGRVAASTQNQALNALVFLYREDTASGRFRAILVKDFGREPQNPSESSAS